MLPESKRKVALESSLVKEMFHNFVSNLIAVKAGFHTAFVCLVQSNHNVVM